MRLTTFQQFVSTAFFAVFAVAVFSGAYFWMFNQIGKLGASVEEDRDKILFLEEEWKAVHRIDILLSKREADVLRIKNFFVEPEKVVEFIESMEALAKNIGNKISIDFDEAKSSGENYYFRFTVDGTAEGVIGYLRALELYPAEIRIQDFIFQRLLQAVGGPTYRLIINVAVRKLPALP